MELCSATNARIDGWCGDLCQTPALCHPRESGDPSVPDNRDSGFHGNDGLSVFQRILGDNGEGVLNQSAARNISGDATTFTQRLVAAGPVAAPSTDPLPALINQDFPRLEEFYHAVHSHPELADQEI